MPLWALTTILSRNTEVPFTSSLNPESVLVFMSTLLEDVTDRASPSSAIVLTLKVGTVEDAEKALSVNALAPVQWPRKTATVLSV